MQKQNPPLRRGAVLCFFLSFLFAANFCHASDKTVEVVGTGECADCKESNLKTSHAFAGLRVTIDCKTDGDLKTRGSGQLDAEGNFKVIVSDGIVKDGKLNQECYAKLHSAAAKPCPTLDDVESSKIILKSDKDGKQTLGIVGKLKFSPSNCASAFFWHFFHHPPLATVPTPVYQPPTPVYQPPTPVYQPPTPVYQPPTPVYQPPTPVYHPPTPVYKHPVLPPPTPVYTKPPVYKKPKPKCKTPVYKHPVYKHPVYKHPVYKKPYTPVPVYKPPAPVYTHPLPPPIPVYKPKHPYFKHLPPFPPLPPLYKKPLPPFPSHPIYGGFPPLPPHPKYGLLPPLPPHPKYGLLSPLPPHPFHP